MFAVFTILKDCPVFVEVPYGHCERILLRLSIAVISNKMLVESAV